jgi:predicted Zn-dependent peptidase
MLKLRPLAYKIHPYLWPTIGKDISHIEKVNLKQIKDFFFSHYAPNNAILAVAGNIDQVKAYKLAEKWFGPVEKREIAHRDLPREPKQNEERKLTVEKDVPSNVIYKAWHTCSRINHDFYSLDLLTDILAGGESGRLYSSLVRDKKLFSDINTYLTGEFDPGLLIINGKIMDGVDIFYAEEAVMQIVEELKKELIGDQELEKVKNKFEATMVFSNTSILNKAMNLSIYELLGDAGALNKEVEIYRSVNSRMVIEAAGNYLSNSNCNTLYYKSIK